MTCSHSDTHSRALSLSLPSILCLLMYHTYLILSDIKSPEAFKSSHYRERPKGITTTTNSICLKQKQQQQQRIWKHSWLFGKQLLRHPVRSVSSLNGCLTAHNGVCVPELFDRRHKSATNHHIHLFSHLLWSGESSFGVFSFLSSSTTPPLPSPTFSYFCSVIYF